MEVTKKNIKQFAGGLFLKAMDVITFVLTLILIALVLHVFYDVII